MGKDFDDFKRNSGKKTCISAGAALIIWLIVLIILIVILRACRIGWFSAIVFSAIVAAFVLCFVFPLDIKNSRYRHKSEDSIFGLIWLVTAILVIIYIIWKVFTDRDESYQSSDSWWGDSWGSEGKTIYKSGHIDYSVGSPGAGSYGLPSSEVGGRF